MPVTIRFRLLLLVLSVVLPGALGTGWLIRNALESERAAHERTLRDTSRALSLVVGRELAQRTAIARVLAASRWLDDGEHMQPDAVRGFEVMARRSLQGMEGWIELRSAEGVLLDTRQPPQARINVTAPGAPLATVAAVQPLSPGPDAPQAAYAAVVQPVERDGRVALNLVVTLLPAELQRIVDGQKLPPDWIGTVMDDRGTVVARHPGGSAFVGRHATADLRERIASRNDGLFQSVSLDGRQTVGFFSTSPQGWSYTSAMPRGEFQGSVAQAARQAWLGALALLVLPVAGALWLARRIVEPVQALKAAAGRLQGGARVEHQPTGITEIDDVGRALAQAAEVLQRNRIELVNQVEEAVARTREAEQRVSKSQRVEALGRLTGGVAHDFNNLLGVISNSLHLLEHPRPGVDTQLPLAAMRRAVETGSQLTQHLLRFAGRGPVRPQALALQHWLPEVLELLHSVLGQRIRTSVRVQPDTAPIRVDAGELELALVNLAINARDAMKREGSLRLTAQNADVADTEGLPGAPQQRYVMITVSDDGSGIDAEVAARVFEPFFTTKPPGQGSGLGLSQVHGFCTQAGGGTRLASTPGLGTSVSLLLPAADAARDAFDATEDSAAPAPQLAGLRLLLVDDNEELGAVTAELLRSHGVDVRRAADAAGALRLLAAQPVFDVVLSDVVMPGKVDGLSLARQIRSAHPGLPVLLISGFTTAATGSEFRLLRKPCAAGELLRALHDATRRPLAPGSAAQASR